MSKIKKLYEKICNWLSIKNITLLGVVIFVLTMIPICYLSFFNRATGDDYGYGANARLAWVATHSLVEVWKASMQTIRQCYIAWQGTWFDLFLFTIQPEVFSQKAYVIVTFLMLFLWCGSTWVLFKEIFVNKLQMETWSFRLITLVFMVINIQYIPSTKSSMYWYNGCAHYMIPFAMCQLLAYWLLKFGQEYKIRYWIGIFIFMTLLGGANYQAALFGMIITFYSGIAEFIKNKNKKVFLLILPVISECIGLYYSFISPGNKARGGEDFGFSVGLAVETILNSFLCGITDILGYLQSKTLIFVGLIVIFLVFLENAKKRERREIFGWQILVVLALFCLYSAMQAPAIYAGVDVSGGVYNMNYQCFLLMAMGVLYVLAEVIGSYLKNASAVSIHKNVVIPGLVVCCMLILVCRSNIKDSTTWKCIDYITSGQAADFKEQMEIQTRLMMDESTEDVIVPFVNHDQGPLMHMPVTADKEAWSNSVTSHFYGKKSVVAIDRPLWESMQK